MVLPHCYIPDKEAKIVKEGQGICLNVFNNRDIRTRKERNSDAGDEARGRPDFGLLFVEKQRPGT